MVSETSFKLIGAWLILIVLTYIANHFIQDNLAIILTFVRKLI